MLKLVALLLFIEVIALAADDTMSFDDKVNRLSWDPVSGAYIVHLVKKNRIYRFSQNTAGKDCLSHSLDTGRTVTLSVDPAKSMILGCGLDPSEATVIAKAKLREARDRAPASSSSKKY